MKEDKLNELDQYIKDNLNIENQLEYQFFIFRVMTNATNISTYLENTIIRREIILHGALQTELEAIYASVLALAVNCIPTQQYLEFTNNLISPKYKKVSTLDLRILLTYTNSIIYTSSQIANTIIDIDENKDLVKSLILDLLAELYKFADLLGSDMETIGANLYDTRKANFISITDLVLNNESAKKSGDEEEEIDFKIDIILHRGKYAEITLISNKIHIAHYSTGHIIRDFFNCTLELRKKDHIYSYSEQLYQHIMNNENITQAYIYQGELRTRDNMSEKTVAYYQDNPDEFGKNFHHILITPSMNTMDDFLEYIYHNK